MRGFWAVGCGIGSGVVTIDLRWRKRAEGMDRGRSWRDAPGFEAGVEAWGLWEGVLAGAESSLFAWAKNKSRSFDSAEVRSAPNDSDGFVKLRKKTQILRLTTPNLHPSDEEDRKSTRLNSSHL